MITLWLDDIPTISREDFADLFFDFSRKDIWEEDTHILVSPSCEDDLPF